MFFLCCLNPSAMSLSIARASDHEEPMFVRINVHSKVFCADLFNLVYRVDK
jgi:hypothetical protein